jgi:DNA-binding response OmpR family regulator
MQPEQTVLIIEDSRTEVEYLTSVLAFYGFEAIVAEDGIAGLLAVDNQKPALIILDINLPKMDGYQVCSRLKRDPNTKDIPVIMLTSSDNAASTIKGLQSGVDDFISKDDFATENLIDTLRVYLNFPDKETN